ncbi:MAG: dienelactone hydrolase family protein [Gemmatimonadetes bacterium]|nr:MAG: dienelactone hydrolase family protein [Gemmatimonadota bacterium]
MTTHAETRWTPAIALALAAAAALACTEARPDQRPAASEHHAAAAQQEVDLPAAVLGKAPPPSGEAVHYWADDERTVGYLAVPEGEGPFPAVILIHEWNGLVDRVRQMADEMASQGYVALAADLYRGRTGASREENMALVREARAEPERVIANLDAAARFLRARPDVTGKIATMGWCFGGGIALSYALGGEHHDGTAIFYGSLVTDPERLRAIDHPVYGTFAELDRGIPPDEVERFARALERIGVEHDIHVYDEVGHGFWLRVDEDPETRTAPAVDAWRRLKAYLGRTLHGD